MERKKRKRNFFVFLMFSLMGIYLLYVSPAISIELFILSLYFLFGWMEQRGERYSARLYLVLLVLLIVNGIFSLYIQVTLSISIGLLSFLFALSTWVSYQQLKIDQRKEDEE